MTDKWIYFQPDAGYLRITGQDRITFLQRQTTNDVSNLPENHHLSTVLTTPAARILDVLQVFAEDESTLGVVTLPGRAAETAAFLKRRIFFMDKVSVTDASPEFAIADVDGSGADHILQALDTGTLSSGRMLETSFKEIPLRILAQHGQGWQRVRLIVPAAQRDALTRQLESLGFSLLSHTEYHTRRIAAGLPSWENEWTEAYTPLETGLGTLVSETKGCYTGQEVLARQVTYDKIIRNLAGLQLTAPASPGDSVRVDSQKIGTITSAADSSPFGPIALAVLKRPYFEPGTQVEVEAGGKAAAATVVSLPFGNAS